MKIGDYVLDDSMLAFRAFGTLLQGRLLPALDEKLGPLEDRHREFVRLCAAVRAGFSAAQYEWRGNGRLPASRWSYFKAFLAKAVWNFRSTSALLEERSARPVLRRLCGFENPGDIQSESSFLRVFSRFGGNETTQRVFGKFINRTFDGALVHNPGVDSSAIHAREKQTAPPELSQSPMTESLPKPTSPLTSHGFLKAETNSRKSASMEREWPPDVSSP